jgi:hypothetical protein
MAVRVAIEVVPQSCRPATVEQRLAEVVALHDRHRAAREAVAAAQAELDAATQEDIATAAARARAGEALGQVAVAVKKATAKLEQEQRDTAAILQALDEATTDLGQAITDAGGDWLDALDHEQEAARARALDALDAFQTAVTDLRAAAGARLWLQGALTDQRFDRQPPSPLLGSRAASSARVTANGEALDAGRLFEWCRELVEPPQAPNAQPLAPDAASV